jgi:hypothetical protein
MEGGLTDGDTDIRFSYYADASKGGSYNLLMFFRYVDGSNQVRFKDDGSVWEYTYDNRYRLITAYPVDR